MIKGKVAIVTGAARGIGKAIAYRLASEGANVVVADIDAAGSMSTAEEIAKQTPGDAIGAQVNVTSREDVQKMVKLAIEKWGKVDVLVNNAGITKDITMKRMTDEQWDAVIAVNLKGVFICTQETIQHMFTNETGTRSNGKVVNISSIVGKSGNFGQTNYCASKAGVVGFTKAVAKEYAKYKVQANAIMPGFIRTPMTADIPEKIIAKIVADIPLRDMGEADDIANAVLYLSSDMSDYVTGTTIEVAGGLFM